MPRITISVVAGGGTHDGDIISLDLPPGLSVGDLKGYLQHETQFEPESQVLYFNNRIIRDDTATIDGLGVKDGDMLAMVRRSEDNLPRESPRPGAGTSQSTPTTDPQAIEDTRRRILADQAAMVQIAQQKPALFEALDDSARFRAVWLEMVRGDHQRELERKSELSMLNGDLNVDNQRKIEEMIRQEQVMQNLQFAYQHSPEVFGRVTMLYVPVTVNNHPVKAFVDSGAQTTIMSPSCAEECGIMRLIDKRYSGIARGVGTAQILGRVHAADITIGLSTMSCSFTVMEGKDVDLLLGLDMLKRFQAIIDLKQNKLIFGEGNNVDFLGEAEIPQYMDDAQQNEPTVAGPNGTEIGAKTGTVKPAGTSAAAASSSARDGSFQGQGHTLGSASSSAPSVQNPARPTPSQTTQSASRYPKETIQQLTTLGFSEAEAIQALDACDGNVEFAAGLLFQN